MNKIKRFAAVMLALTLVLAMATAAFAAETVENKTTHAYEAYQIFTGTQAESDATGKLAVAGWGTGVNGEAFLAALKADDKFGAPNIFADAASASEVADLLAANAVYADAFAAVAHRHKTGAPIEIAASAASVDLPAGYYLLVDTADVAGADDAKNVSLLQVTQNGSVTIQQKYDVPTVEKKVKDVNDSTDAEATGWQDGADYDVNDVVPFQLTGTLPSNLDDYETYFYQFNDTISAGLTYNNDARVYLVNGEARTDISASFNLDGAPAVIKCENIKAVSGVTKDSRIVVEYTATLNENAVIGGRGNSNKVNLEFSNNPNFGGDGEHGKTPDDVVIVFTYKVVVNKINEQSLALPGAEFTLFKMLNDGTRKEIAAVKNAEGASFTFNGLDDGSYVLSETKAPAGYNRVADIEFTVTAEHDVLSDDPTLVSLAGTAATGEITFTPNIGEGSLNIDVVNKSGATLPETGGVGTTIFYVLGAVLVVVAGVFLVSRKRMKASEN